MLEKRVENLTKLLSDFVNELQKEVRVDRVYLYGSYARNSEHDFSDIDVAVISPDFEGGTEHDYLILGKAALKVNPLIEAKPYRPEDLKNLSPAEFLAEVLRTGRIVYDKAA